MIGKIDRQIDITRIITRSDYISREKYRHRYIHIYHKDNPLKVKA